MKIVIVGGTGTLGSAISKELSARHDVVLVGHTGGDFQVDIQSKDSIAELFDAIGSFDGLIAATGAVHFGPLTEFTEEQYQIGLNSKLMGQVNLVLEGMKRINQGGSFTLTSGVLSHDPIRFGSSAAMVNGAINAFVKSAAIELPNQLRINVVSPTVLTESLESYAPYFRGFESIPASRAALAYSKSVEGAQTGMVYSVV